VQEREWWCFDKGSEWWKGTARQACSPETPKRFSFRKLGCTVNFALERGREKQAELEI